MPPIDWAAVQKQLELTARAAADLGLWARILAGPLPGQRHGSPGLRGLAPAARAMAAKSGFWLVVPYDSRPDTSISSSTMPSEELLNSTTFTGRSYWTRVRKSPISMENPPSPDMETTWRPRSRNWAPIACGSAFAIEPWLNEPITRRRPLGVR